MRTSRETQPNVLNDPSVWKAWHGRKSFGLSSIATPSRWSPRASTNGAVRATATHPTQSLRQRGDRRRPDEPSIDDTGRNSDRLIVRRIIRRFDGELVPDGDVDRLWGVACRRNAPSDVVLGKGLSAQRADARGPSGERT